MTNTLKLAGAVIAGVVIGLVASSVGGPSFGGVYSNVIKDFKAGISVAGTTVIDSTGAFVGAVNGTTGTFSGDVTVTTSNTATSTITVGCVQTYATSTATAWKLLVVASSTQMAPGYQGLVYAQYGTCPSI